ncbi:MAG: NAD(P)-binding domain-containing protein [Planctomycetota bacterium]
MEHVDAIIVGAGQAGLAVSHELSAAGVEHFVLERGRIGQTWRNRWDTFCLVTPNWTVQLPGHPYSGPDPHGFMARDEIVATLEDFAGSFGAPVREGVSVAGVESPPDGGFILHTTAGDVSSRALVLATGAFQRPHRPKAADTLPAGLPQIDVDVYRNEGALPPGRVLVVGSGQSGAQISEELHEAGREVVLACGKAAWVPRRLGNRDIVWWLDRVGFFDQSVETLPSPAARLTPNPMATGHGGGHDLHLRTLQAMGVTLTGHFLGTEGGLANFAPDLEESAAWGDQRCHELMGLIRRFAAEHGLDLPPIDEPGTFAARAPERVDLSDFGVVIFAGGFRPDYRSWLPWSDAFDEFGFPFQRDGVSSVVPGLFFAGVHFLRTRKSSLLFGVGEDAAIVSRHVGALLTSRPSKG